MNKLNYVTSDSYDIPSVTETVKDLNIKVQDLYYSYDSSEMEAWRLIVESKQYLDENVNIGHVPWSSINRVNIREKVAIIEKYIGIRRDGNPLTLSISDKVFHRNYKQKLINKINKVSECFETVFLWILSLYQNNEF